ncbi:P-selectin-like [Dysidea avara]|uniref:P-selectin-like n=1 Tax=Dysidea avara TaxID=196820 RepID=UPI00331F557D
MVDCSSEGTCVFTCNTGFTLSGSAVRRCQEDGTYTGTQPTCIQGCTHNGGTVEEGQQIQPDCSMRCTCLGGNLQCEPQECPIDGPTCYAVGDPHYRTFDSHFYNFQGGCSYVLAQPCDSDDFSVIARNLAHNERVSCVDQVTISVPRENNFTVVLGRGVGGTVTINGDLQTHTGDGEIYATRDVRVLQIGNNLHVILPTIGVRIFWNGRSRVEVTVSKQWANRVCGMCGDYNGNAADDFQDPDGNALATPNEFGESWETDDTRLFCTPTVEAMCSPEDGARARERCAGMKSAVFSACNKVVDPTTYINDCVVDGCNCEEEDREECFCESFAAYASACTSAGVPVPGWRNLLDCPLPCTGDQTFQQCGSLCPQTCENIGATCTGGCAEGCFCPLGQVINQDGNCEDASTCEPICPRIFAPVDGTISCQLGANNVANPGETCQFTCDDGFTLTGSSSRTCQNDRTWSGTEPMCGTGPTCPPLTAPDNGDIDCSLGDDGEANPGDTCTFTCDDGYELGGSTSRTCGDDGSWSGTDTTCTRVVTCPPLTAPDNGDIDCSLGGDGEANPGDTCTFTCDDGYELGGSTSRTCGDEGSWSGTDTTCTRIPTCPPLTAPDNGDIDCSLGGDGEANPGDTCTFTCDDGYELGGSTSRTCGDDGSWSGTDTTCTRVVTCPPLTAPDNGDIDCSLGGDGEANPGDTCTFTCDDGYELGGSTSRTCGDEGSWSGTSTTCTRIPTCPPLTAPDNGDIDCSLGDDGEANPGDTCTFTCDDGYELGGSTSRTCGDDGSWSGTGTTCTRVQ